MQFVNYYFYLFIPTPTPPPAWLKVGSRVSELVDKLFFIFYLPKNWSGRVKLQLLCLEEMAI